MEKQTLFHFIYRSLTWWEGFLGGSAVKNLPTMHETPVWSLGWKDPLEEEIVTHSSILAWEIPWTGEPGGLQSIGSQKSQTRLSDYTTSWESHCEVSEVAQSCPTLCDLVGCSLPGCSVHGIRQARILEWVAISFSRGSSWSRDQTRVSHLAGRRFNLWATREAQESHYFFSSSFTCPMW